MYCALECDRCYLRYIHHNNHEPPFAGVAVRPPVLCDLSSLAVAAWPIARALTTQSAAR